MIRICNNESRIGLVGVIALVAAALSLSACQTTTADYESRKLARAGEIDAALERAAMEGGRQAYSMASLSELEREYKRNSDDPEAAIAYARALRESDYLNRALVILAPLAGKEDAPSMIQSEYAAVNLGMGNYREAETYARKAVDKNPENYRAYHALGIALDATGRHEQAETAFRKGLEKWEGDPTPVMNNLALNLASQGLLDESVQILHRAVNTAPSRPEIERNLRIVSALQKSAGHVRPVTTPEDTQQPPSILPQRKPDRNEG